LPIDSNKNFRESMRLGDLNEAHRLVKNGLKECGEADNSAQAWLLRLGWADLLRLRGQTAEALSYLASAELSCPPDRSDVASAAGLMKTRGYCLGLLGKYSEAQALMSEAERAAGAAGLMELRCEVHQCQAMVLYLQQDYGPSEELYRKILETSQPIGGWYFRANGLWGIGKNLMIQKRYQEAMPWLEESLSIFELAGARTSMAIVWSELAVCHLGLGDDKKSLELLERALAIQEEAGRVQNYLVALANIGNIYLHRGDHLRAISYYREALALAREIKDPISIRKWSHNLRLAYTRLEDSTRPMR
jgi:tetratricopeptide (TPR) repeat protein